MSQPDTTPVKLVIAYDGSQFSGWQRQPGKRTVQSELEVALGYVLRQKVKTQAASRTDGGVHAFGQVVRVDIPVRFPLEKLPRALNAWLPEDVVVRQAVAVPPDFQPSRDAVAKRYCYIIYDEPTRDVFCRQYCWHYYRSGLDEQAMQRAARLLVGTHDFRSFQARGSPRQNTTRTLFRLDVVRLRRGEGCLRTPFDFAGLMASATSNSHDNRAGQGGWILVDVIGDGFLYQMVRTIVGTLVEVGRGNRPVWWVADVLAAKDRTKAGPTAPPQGLFLAEIYYRPLGNKRD